MYAYDFYNDINNLSDLISIFLKEPNNYKNTNISLKKLSLK